jgi:hypothetical protein
MKNKLGMVGMGKVTNGVMTFVDATGKGFSKTIARPVVTENIKEEITMDKKEVFELDIPEFMKDYKKNRPQLVSNVIHVNFGRKEEEVEVSEEEEERDPGKEFIDEVLGAIGKVIKRNPVVKYFFDVEDK